MEPLAALGSVLSKALANVAAVAAVDHTSLILEEIDARDGIRRKIALIFELSPFRECIDGVEPCHGHLLRLPAMDEIILKRAKEIFGEHRFEEIMGALWLARDTLASRAAGRGGLDSVLREWENRFRRDVEEGRVQNKAGQRRRVLRFGELEEPDGAWMSPEDKLSPRIRRKF